MRSDDDWLNEDTMAAGAIALGALQRLSRELEELGFYLDNELRLWHTEGWSQGRLAWMDDFWRFVVDYKDEFDG